MKLSDFPEMTLFNFVWITYGYNGPWYKLTDGKIVNVPTGHVCIADDPDAQVELIETP